MTRIVKRICRKIQLIPGVALVATLVLIHVSFAASLPNGGGSAVWSPDGHALAFVSATPNTPVELWVSGWSGHPMAARQMTHGGGRLVAWMPDGKSLIYETYREAGRGFYIANLTGGADRSVLRWLPATVPAVVLSPDGRQVAYTLSGDDKRNLWVADLDGGSARQLTTKLNVRTPAWSSDGKRLAFDVGGVYGEATFVVEAAGGEPKRVFGGIGSYPSWSPDGKWLVTLGMHAATLISPDGAKAQRLHISQDDRVPLSWSPDSKFITYTGSEGVTRTVARVEVATGKMETLTKGWVRTAGAQFSPDGRTIAFEGLKQGESAARAHVLEVGSKRDWPVTASWPSEWSPRLSGDGSALFYLSNQTPRGTVALFRKGMKSGKSEALLAIDPRASCQINWPPASPVGVLTLGSRLWLLSSKAAPRQLLETEHPTSADLSARGDRLIYVSWTQHRSSLVMRQLSDNSEKEILAPFAAGQAYSKVAWSPQGDDVAFVRGDALCRLGLKDGRVSELMSSGAGGLLLPPMWSRRGQALAIGRFVRGAEPKLEIWKMSRSGQSQRLIASATVSNEHGWLADPLAAPYAWSPDGRLAYCLEHKGGSALYLADLNHDPAQVSVLREAAAYPEWPAAGRDLIYTDLSGNRERTMRLPVAPITLAPRPAPASPSGNGGT